MIRTLAFAVSIGLAACNYGGKPEYSVEKTLKAKRVRLDVEQEGTNAVIKGEELTFNLDTLEMDLSGNVSVSLGQPFYVRADEVKISFRRSFDFIELKGDVRAYLGEEKQEAIDVGSPHP